MIGAGGEAMVCRTFRSGQPCSLCVEGLKGKRVTKGHAGRGVYGSSTYGGNRMALTRPSGAAPGSGGGGALAGGDAATLFPTLWEYLSGDTWDDGSARATSTMLAFVEDGMVKLCVNDRALQRKAWMTGRSPEAALAALEAALAAGNIEWRPDKAPGTGKRR